jgi:hypothetical protein
MNSRRDADGVKGSSELARRVLRAAWLGVLLGLLIEVLLLAVAFWQDQLPEGMRIVADTVQKLSWSSLICAALVAGQTAVRQRAAIAGISGLLAAPAAFLTARALHQASLEVLGAGIVASASQWLTAGVKGIEYALLSVAIAWLSKRDVQWQPYVLAGAVIGTAAYVLTWMLLPAPGDPLQRAVVEISHPIGCALAVHISSQVHARLGGVGGEA